LLGLASRPHRIDGWQGELDALIDKDSRDHLKFGAVELIS